MVPDSAMTAPTDRSMPPVRITKVMPTARMPTIETCRSTFMMFETEKKFSEAKPIRTETTMSPISGRASGECRIQPRLNPPPLFFVSAVLALCDMSVSPGRGVGHDLFGIDGVGENGIRSEMKRRIQSDVVQCNSK